jgi:hypothetical protein
MPDLLEALPKYAPEHPGAGWYCVDDIAKAMGASISTARTLARDKVASGEWEQIRVKKAKTIAAYYRLKP